MACGLPTVLSDIASHLELYEGTKGDFFKTKDFHKLGELLKEILQNLESQKNISLQLVKNNFSANAMSEKYQNFYMEKLDELEN